MIFCRKADMIESENSEGEIVRFNHPFLQASFMFLGESLCMVVFLITLGFKVFVEINYLKVF